jgi:predicted AAA+ superfamily ATPase
MDLIECVSETPLTPDLKNIDDAPQNGRRSSRTRASSCPRALPANNVLLTGSRGTGKSSLIKACLNWSSPR